jgi:membrane associated rhomboid family serine protease
MLFTVCFSYLGFRDNNFTEKYYFNIDSILGYKQFYRIITSGFLHGDIGHLIFNLISFYSFSRGIELIFGIHYTVAIYFISLIGGNLLALYVHRFHYDYSALGASGAVSGIVFASIFLLPGGSIYIYFVPIPIPAYLYAIFYVGVSIFGIKTKRDNIGHEAHLGGAITGVLLVLLLSPASIKNSLYLFILIMVIFAVFIGYLFYDPLMLPAKLTLDSIIHKCKPGKKSARIKKIRAKLRNDLQTIMEKAKEQGNTGIDN